MRSYLYKFLFQGAENDKEEEKDHKEEKQEEEDMSVPSNKTTEKVEKVGNYFNALLKEPFRMSQMNRNQMRVKKRKTMKMSR